MGVSHPPTFKPKAVNGKRLVAANHQVNNYYNVVVWDTPFDLDVAEAATSRRQKLEIRYQNFKVSPAATYLNISNNACGMDTPFDLVEKTKGYTYK